MGNSTYNFNDRSIRSASLNTKSRAEIFSKYLHDSMKSQGITIRESRDSDTHPLSVPIIIAMDVTGSMGFIPEELVKRGLPHIIEGLMKAGIADPQILFLAIGDHITDRAPLQVGQFESGDVELDMWLERTWLESGGGGNGGESYGLAWYFAANHTVTDHWEKRNQKGFLFTIGDERNHKAYPASALRHIMGNDEIEGTSLDELLPKVKEKWHVYHILPGFSTDNSETQWRELLKENVSQVEATEIASHIITTVSLMLPNNVTPEEIKGTTENPKKLFL